MKNCGPVLIVIVLAAFTATHTFTLSNKMKLISHIKHGNVMVGNEKKPVLFNIITMQDWANKRKNPSTTQTGIFPHGPFPHASFPHSSFHQGSFPHGSYPTGTFPTGTMPPKFPTHSLATWIQSNPLMNNLWLMLKEMMLLTLHADGIQRDSMADSAAGSMADSAANATANSTANSTTNSTAINTTLVSTIPNNRTRTDPPKMTPVKMEPIAQESEMVTETTATKLEPQKVFLLLEVDESLLSGFNDTEILNNLLTNATIVEDESLPTKPEVVQELHIETI